MRIEDLEDGLKKVVNSTSRREGSRIAGWLNGSYGDTRENRVRIQGAASTRRNMDRASTLGIHDWSCAVLNHTGGCNCGKI